MKKLTTIALALCMGFMLAAPVMAVDADFSGAYRVRGLYTEHWDLRDTSASNAFMNMRFRLQTVFKASDILSVTTRFDALDNKVWGDSSSGIYFDRAYMTIKSGIGKFDIGRMAGGTWGTTFVDSESDYDRIKFTKTIDNLTMYLVFQKSTEADDARGAAAAVGADAADLDSDTYYFLAKQKMENLTAGVLLAFNNNKTVATATTRKYSAIPYFVGKFGPLAIQGELAYNWGETDFDAAGTADLDIKEIAYNIEATYDFGIGSVMAGYAFVSGDNDGDADNEDSAYGGVGNDWEKLFILTTNENAALVQLGGMGNLSNDGVAFGPNPCGAKIFYGGVNYSPLENLTLGFIVGKADADKVPATWKDEYGIEYDFTLNWKIYDNLTYTAIVAFLDAGEIYYGATSGVAPDYFDDTYALFHQLQLAF